MKNLMKCLLPAVLLTTVSAQAPAPSTIKLWPGAAPGSEAWKQPETTVGNPGNRRIMNVSTPTLTSNSGPTARPARARIPERRGLT